MDNSSKIILDLCGGSGAWSKPYKDVGYDAHVITLPDYDVGMIYGFHDCIEFRAQTFTAENMRIPYDKIYGVLAAPPCTEFSFAKNGSHRQRDFAKGMTTVEACMRIIWEIQKRTKLQFWALENPQGYLNRFLGNPPYSFYQWQFGEERVKRTYLWGKFKPPTPIVKKRPEGITVRYKRGDSHSKGTYTTNSKEWGKRTNIPEEHREYIANFRGDKRAAVRAITPRGFAEAFYKANN